ncbi:hypothetical protein V1525DRAFT_428640 [Lipomyces kononenkoae]|uniref:Uncharacterized protein n=1 Tax=Lipomyces kononenkoae TaxID=34357 RepID=A0ACC3SSG1_LIPKO
MSSVYQCTECHAPFDARDKLNRHVSISHRKLGGFSFEGVTYPLIMTQDDKYACPTCGTESSNLSNLRRHMAARCRLHITRRHGINSVWNVITCNRCNHIVDKSMVEDHFTNNAMWSTIRAYRVTPHLAVQLGDADDEYAARTGCESAAVEGVSVHRCRNHANQVVDFSAIAENDATADVAETDTDDITKFGIPANFGRVFFAYKLLEWLDLAELEMLHSPRDRSFDALKRITTQMLEDSRADVTAGFQVMLGKVMVGDEKRLVKR